MTTRMFPVVFVWRQVEIISEDGEATRRKAMVPLLRYDNMCGRQYQDGEEYALAPIEARSRKSHNGYFASVSDAFDNLPETIAARWPTAEHMRKWVLIETGWFHEKEFTFEGRDAQRDARRLGTFIREEDEYARIIVSKIDANHVKVIVRKAKSQSAAAMQKEPFETSKKDVLDWLENAIGLAKGELKKNAGRSA